MREAVLLSNAHVSQVLLNTIRTLRCEPSHFRSMRFHALARNGKSFHRPSAAIRSEAVHVPWRTAESFVRFGWRCFPASFEPAALLQAHQDWIKRAAEQAGFAAEGIAVMPTGGRARERCEQLKGLL